MMASVSNILSRPAEEFGNDEEIEMAWVVKATQHMEIYFNLITSVDPRFLKLTPYDDAIYKEFRTDFPDLDVKVLNTEALKSPESKEKWRPFCEKFNYVEDFNYGTIVRLDSGGEYNDSNSIFVPRIQFYALEIARNREGHNDSLRKKFKPIKEEESSEDKIFNTNPLGALLLDINNALVIKNHKCIIKLENGTSYHGDISLHFKDLDNQESLNSVCHFLQKENFKLPLLKCSKGFGNVTYSKLKLELNRTMAFETALRALNRLTDKYGSKIETLSEIAWIVSETGDKDEIRNNILTLHLTSLVRANGYRVYTDKIDPKDGSSLELDCPSCFSCRESFDSVISRTYTNSVSLMEDTDGDVNLEKAQLFSNINLSRMKSCCVKKNNVYSNEFNLAAKLSHVSICCKSKKPKIVFYVTSNSNSHKTQQLASLCHIFGPSNIKHVIFVFGPILCPGVDPELEHLQTLNLDSVQKVMTQKYGLHILDDPEWAARMNILARTGLRIECLSVSPLSRVQIGCDPRAGCFIQYNCSRLNALFQRYEEEIEMGNIQKCHFKDLDFTLLKKEEEWHLLFRYILLFPIIVEESIDYENHKLPLHRICILLQRLSKDFSHYYSRVKLFTPISLRNPSLLHARIQLLRGVYQIFKNSLSLIQLEPLRAM